MSKAAETTLLALAAGWPVLRWFVARLGDGGDERFGLVALGLALALTPRAVWREHVASWRLPAAGALVLLAAFPASGMPMLARAVSLVSALAVLFCRGGGALGRAGLLALSLPLTATLQFFAGYPLRVLTAEAGRPLIALFGVATRRAGVALNWAGGQVVVDAPCSGVHMLWTGGVLACALAAWLRLGVWRTLALGAAGFAGILLGNAVRAAVLFFIESGLWSAPGWAHEGVGLAVFAVVAAGMLWLGLRLKAGVTQRAQAPVRRPPVEPKSCDDETNARPSRRHRPAFVVLFVTMCAVAAALPFVRAQKREVLSQIAFPGWPETFEGRPWIRLNKPANAAAFASGFSGETGVFKQAGEHGGRLVVMRWIREASRGVHPAADCFRASGYEIRAGGLVRDARGILWAEFFAKRADESWRVRERWHDGRGGAWTDVSAWYWAAVRDESDGPWWALAVAERME